MAYVCRVKQEGESFGLVNSAWIMKKHRHTASAYCSVQLMIHGTTLLGSVAGQPPNSDLVIIMIYILIRLKC